MAPAGSVRARDAHLLTGCTERELCLANRPVNCDVLTPRVRCVPGWGIADSAGGRGAGLDMRRGVGGRPHGGGHPDRGRAAAGRALGGAGPALAGRPPHPAVR